MLCSREPGEWAIDQRQGDLRSARDRSPISTHFPGISISGQMWCQVTPLDDGLDCTPLGIYDEWPQRKLVCRAETAAAVE